MNPSARAQRSTWLVAVALVLAAPLAAQRSRIVVGLPSPRLARGMLAWDELREVDGFAKRLILAAAEEVGLVLEFRAVEAEGLDALLAGEIDVSCPVSISEAHLERAAFTAPILISEGAVFVRAGEPAPRTAAELRARRVSVAGAGISHRYCLENEITVQVGQTLIEALRAVARGDADCALTTQLAGRFEVELDHLAGLRDSVFEDGHMRQAYAFALRREDGELRSRLDFGLARVRDRGQWDELYDRWVAPYQPRARPRSFVPLVIAAVLVVALLGLGGVLVLRARLAGRTRALDESERRYRAVAESLPALVFEYFVAYDGRRERRYATSNLAEWRQRFPVLDPGADYRAMLDSIHADDQQRFEAAVAEARAHRSRFDIEYRLRAADGGYRWLHAMATPIPLAGGTLWQSLLLDTTPLHEARDERHRLELQLLEAQRFEGLGVMAGGIAHDFNNLLMDVQGNIELALEAGDARRRRAFLEEALRGTRQASERTRELLAGAGEATLQREELDLAALARAAVDERGDGVTVQLEAPASGPLVRGDAALLRQVAANLIANAAEAVRELGRGRVIVRVARVELRGDDAHAPLEPGPHALLEVEDDGVGMDAATQRRIFDPYFTTKAAGRGLGLAVALRTVRRHGGELGVRSTPGQGAVFRVLLPLARAAAPERELVPVRPGSNRILVVDDDPRVLSVTSSLIASRGWTVERAHDAESALRLARERLPDVVLLDLTMPGTNGLEVLGRLRAEHPHLPVVLMSGYSERATAGAEVAADGFVQKPFTGDQLVAVLNGVLHPAPRERQTAAHAPSGD